MPGHNPLQPISTNTLATPPSAPRPVKLAPIFTRTYTRTPTTSASIPHTSSPIPSSDVERCEPARKRARLSDAEDLETEERSVRHARVPSVQDYFITTPLRGESYGGDAFVKVTPPKPTVVDDPVAQGMWRRKRSRFGVSARGGPSALTHRPVLSHHPAVPYLGSLVTRLGHDPLQPPSLILIPSIHPHSLPRDHAPPLAVAFSHSAKLYSAQAARDLGRKRMIAVAAEEGGVRIINVDEAAGNHPLANGIMFRAHGNACLDVKWSSDDSQILTCAGDATSRLHSIDGARPTLLASLTGHRASVKAATFFDPTRSKLDPSISSSVIATTGRDGHIMIYDIRTRGQSAPPATRRTSRARYSDGLPGFAPEIGSDISPVMKIANAHASLRAGSPKSVTSLVALSTMPGVLASGASHEGIVKLWDPRFPNTKSSATALASLPDPTADIPGKRSRGIHAMIEQLTTGDLHVLTGDSKIHVLRASSALSPDISSSGIEEYPEAIQPVRYVHPELRSSFWMGISFSPCGRYLASGSARGGVMTWDTQHPSMGLRGMREVTATRLSMGADWQGSVQDREVNAVDWGYDMLAACADDCGTRIWRQDPEIAVKLKKTPKMKDDWAGVMA